MIPIHEVLSRIRWDRQFGEGDFVIGYYDRVEDAVIRVPMRELFFRPDNHSAFDLIDRDGVLHSVPLHRIREVYRNDKLIWHRAH
jgi:uncharacterized protein (UPF0248 family)